MTTTWTPPAPSLVAPSLRGSLSFLLRAAFVVPMSQVAILDLPYQLYTFEVFHLKGVNRWSHFVGIPLSLAATYAVASRFALGPLALFALVAGIQVAICLRARLTAMIPVVLVAHALIAVAGTFALTRVLGPGHGIWRSAELHVVLWPALQYLTHILEEALPPPWSGSRAWISTRELLTNAPKHRLVLAALMAPAHVLVELISSHRNSFLVLLLCAERCGYRPASLARLRAWIARECAKSAPVVEYDEFRRAWSAWRAAAPRA